MLNFFKFTRVLGVYRMYINRYTFGIQLSFSFLLFSYLYLSIIKGSTLLDYTVHWLVIYIHIYPNNFALYSFNITQIYSLNPKTWNPISLDKVGYISRFPLKIRQRNWNFIIFLDILSIQDGVENKKRKAGNFKRF